MNSLSKYAELGGRVFLAAMFLLSGLGKLSAYTATAGFMASQGVPGWLLPLVIATEIGGGLAIALGWKTRIAAFLLAGFTLIAALIFHSHFADQNQMIHFWKNVAIAGGFLLLVVHGAGPLSLDQRFGRAIRAVTA
jgi:putative oxidoreductase